MKNIKISNLIRLFSLTILFLLLLACNKAIPPAKNIELHPLFTDNMVLQQKQDIPVWGLAEPGGEVIVTLNEKEAKAIVGEDGKWQVNLPSVPAGGPYQLVISGEQTKVFENVLVGEVWICSGQSNMEMSVSAGWGKIDNYQEEVANAKYPDIRLFMVDKKMAERPLESLESDGWKELSPESVPEFSAVAYFFGRRLHKDLNVPIALNFQHYLGVFL